MTRQWPIAKQTLAQLDAEDLSDFRQLLKELEELSEYLLEKRLGNQTT